MDGTRSINEFALRHKIFPNFREQPLNNLGACVKILAGRKIWYQPPRCQYPFHCRETGCPNAAFAASM